MRNLALQSPPGRLPVHRRQGARVWLATVGALLVVPPLLMAYAALAERALQEQSRAAFTALRRRVEVGRTTRQDARSVIAQYQPDSRHTGWSGEYDGFTWSGPVRIQGMAVYYTPLEGQDGLEAAQPVPQRKYVAYEDQPGTDVLRRATYGVSGDYLTSSLRLLDTPYAFLIPLYFGLIATFGHASQDRIVRLGLTPFLLPALLWFPYAIWEICIARAGIRIDLLLIWPILFLPTVSTIDYSTWRLLLPR